MDFAERWQRFLSESPEILGGAYLSADGILIGGSAFGDADGTETVLGRCAAAAAIARQLTDDMGCGAFQCVILEMAQGHIVLMPFLDKAVLAAVIRKEAKLGLVLLDMRRGIDTFFGPGLASEPISPPPRPKYDPAHANPDDD